jgi:restriction system protein
VVYLLILGVLLLVVVGTFAIILAVLKAIADWLGRKHLLAQAFIPQELIQPPIPQKDLDKKRLLEYHPREATPVAVRVQRFEGRIDELFREPSRPLEMADIDSVCELLRISPTPEYESWIASAGTSPSYPVPPPPRPVPESPPPTWQPWMPELREPSFKAPYYCSLLAFLNPFVDRVYRAEMERVGTASQKRNALVEQCFKRNEEVASLAARARVDFDLAVSRQEEAYTTALGEHAKNKAEFEKAYNDEQNKLVAWRDALLRPGELGLYNRIDAAQRTAKLPAFISREGQSRVDSDSGILIHEHRFPDLAALNWVRQVPLKSARWHDSGWTVKPANQREKNQAALKVYPSLCLRLASEIIRLDTDSILKGVVINGWADYIEKATGQQKRAYCASVFAIREQLVNVRLQAVDPIEAFAALKGRAARSLEVTPVSPVIRFETNDPRFVDGKEVLGHMSEGDNLAVMDWEDFEHLCRQLFERAFASSGAEVKITQVSRDRGVDAIIFDPDPLRGGKIVIQAKRYTGPVDVSAVRDLYGTVHNEGAIKGILVTTSHFGVDSYAFAKDKPLTLLDGSQLLGLLEQHGYKFRIDLTEAKQLL